MVAKSYQKLEQIGEPFVENKRTYVIVKTNAGIEKKVRWYTDAEYYRAHPEEAVVSDKVGKYNHRYCLGFKDNGYITLFIGKNVDSYSRWFAEKKCAYSRFWGWYAASDIDFGEPPATLRLIRLDWDLVGKSNGDLKTDEEVTKAINSLIYEPCPSEFQGNIGEKIERRVYLSKIVNYETNFGSSSTYYFYDKDSNEYQWTTSTAVNIKEDELYNVTAKVKDHVEIKGHKITKIFYCKFMEV